MGDGHLKVTHACLPCSVLLLWGTIDLAGAAQEARAAGMKQMGVRVEVDLKETTDPTGRTERLPEGKTTGRCATHF